MSDTQSDLDTSKVKGPHLTPDDDETIKLVNTDREEGDEDE